MEVGLTLRLQINLLLNQIINLQINFINSSLENSREKTFIQIYIFRNNIWRVDLADLQSLSKYNKGINFLSCAIDLFSKYALVASLKYKRGITIVNAIHKIISKVRKPNKIWVDQGGEFYNKLLKRFLKINNIKTDSTYNKVNSVFPERFIIMLKNKISNHITVFSKNVYFDVLYDVISNASSC